MVIRVRRVGRVRREYLDFRDLQVNQVKRGVQVKEACRDLPDHEGTRERLEWTASLAPRENEESQGFLVLAGLVFLGRVATKETKAALVSLEVQASPVCPVSKEIKDFRAYRDPWVNLESRVLQAFLEKELKESRDHRDNPEKQDSQEYQDSPASRAQMVSRVIKEIRVFLVSRVKRDTREILASLDSLGLLVYRALMERKEREGCRVFPVSQVQREPAETLDSKENLATEDSPEKRVVKALQVHRGPKSLLKETSDSQEILACLDLEAPPGFLDIKDSKV